jgi:hypothetical protein
LFWPTASFPPSTHPPTLPLSLSLCYPRKIALGNQNGRHHKLPLSLKFFQNNGKLVSRKRKMIQNARKSWMSQDKSPNVLLPPKWGQKLSPETAGKSPQCSPQIPCLPHTGPAFSAPSLSRSLPGIKNPSHSVPEK